MTAPRLPEVVARVVAWHNRHPLARRIDASQVHSIGEVRLPFASARAWGDAPPPAPATPAEAPAPATSAADEGHAPTLAEALAQRHARQAPVAAPGIDGLDVATLQPEDTPPAAPDPALPPELNDTAPSAKALTDDDSDEDGEAALVIPLLDGDAAAAPADAAADPDPDPADTADTAAEPDADIALDLGDPVLPAATPEADASAGPPEVVAELQAATTADAPAEFPDVYPPPHGRVPASALARAVERRAAARASGAGGEPPTAASIGADTGALPSFAAPAPAGRWRRLVDTLRRLFTGRQAGLPPLRAAFSADFAWPLRPGAVARWAQRHGRPEPLAPLDWPRRSIDTDRARLARHRGKGFAHDLPLHVLTAAIGVGDRRIRVLIGADGSVLGPRAFDRSRSTGAAMLLGAGLVALGWTLRPLHAPPADATTLLAAVPAVAASAPAVPASAASSPTVSR